MKKSNRAMKVSAESEKSALTFEAKAEITVAAASKDGKAGRPTFKINAYNGGLLRLSGWYNPVVVDLKGLRAGRVAILKDHDPSQIVGQGTATIGESSVDIEGTVTGDYEAAGTPAAEVVGHARNGFVWGASIGATVDRIESVAPGAKVRVNGQQFTGPLAVVRAGRLGETSFVGIGADETASATVAAKAANPGRGDTNMGFDEYVKGLGFDPAALTAEQKANLKAKYDAEQAAKAEHKEEKKEEPAPEVRANSVEMQMLEAERCEKIEQLAVTAAGTSKDLEILRKVKATKDLALKDKWPASRAEEELLRAARKQNVPAIHCAEEMTNSVRAKAMEAAIALSGRLAEVDKKFDDKTLSAADKLYPAGITLGEVILTAARANGYEGISLRGNLKEVLRMAFGQDIRANAGWSTVDLSGVLSNNANKFLLDGFNTVEMTWRRICAIKNVTDFKQTKSYRMTGGFEFSKVGSGGELKHGTLGEEVFYNQADTYGTMLSVTRTDIINDDLGAITAVPKRLGRGAGLAINRVFWTEFLDDSTFFTLAANNLLSGATTALSVAGLRAAKTLFRKQVDSDSNPLGLAPRILLVPAELEGTGNVLLTAQEIRQGGDDAYPTANEHKTTAISLEVSSYLSNTAFTGYSLTAWYLMGSPQVVPVIEVALLNGREAPVIETADADFNVLGISMRGYHDFGVALQDGRGAVKCDGEAAS